MTVKHEKLSKINRLTRVKFLASRVSRGYGVCHSLHNKKAMDDRIADRSKMNGPIRTVHKLGSIIGGAPKRPRGEV